MLYRDLIPGRLGGRYIASHITIPEGGPVADWVHYHRIAFQLIVVRRGWVRVVYEDQGEPFVMSAGDLVLQPPGIRHRVLESSPGLEVVEISARRSTRPSPTTSWRLPNGARSRPRLRRPALPPSCRRRRRGRSPRRRGRRRPRCDATRRLADVALRPRAPIIAFRPHDGELVFGFVLEGSAMLDFGEASRSARPMPS